MNLATKAALFNALIFPGWGQIYLKKYKKGILIIIAISAGVISILWSVAQATINILKIAPIKKGTVTFFAVVQLAIDAVKALNLFYLYLILFFMILLWILSIIDAYHIRKKRNDENLICPLINNQLLLRLDFTGADIFQIINSHRADFAEYFLEIFLPQSTADLWRYFFNSQFQNIFMACAADNRLQWKIIDILPESF